MSHVSAGSLLATAYRHPLYMQHLVVNKFASLARYRWAERHTDRDDRVPPPLGYQLVLTYKCNLRCIMCYEWGDVGWCHELPRTAIAKELDWVVIERLFAETGRRRPYFILIGGEPLLYSRFGELAQLLRRTKSFAITCTNGMMLDRFDLSDNPYLTFLISLDGPETENDLLRGQGVFRTVTRNIARLKALTRPPYIGIEFTIRPENVGVMYEFCQEMVALGVDWILLNPCWFISESQARAYESFMQTHFDITPKTHLGYLMPYEIDKDEFVRQMEKIDRERWPIQISSYLKRPEHIYTYVDRPEVPPDNAFCYRQWARMDITPDGDVAPCILYPDLVVGNLRDQRVLDVWNGPDFTRFRQLRRREILPVCAKCNALYLHDARRKHL
jgi:radical SAM protein with 4Fe4S-binding SPASM domain